MKLSIGNRQFALHLGAITILACLCAPPAQAEPPKPKDGPLGMKFVPLPKATFYNCEYDDGRQGEVDERYRCRRDRFAIAFSRSACGGLRTRPRVSPFAAARTLE